MSEKLERKVLRSSSHRLSSENINIDSSLQEEQSVLPSPRMRNLGISKERIFFLKKKLTSSFK